MAGLGAFGVGSMAFLFVRAVLAVFCVVGMLFDSFYVCALLCMLLLFECYVMVNICAFVSENVPQVLFQFFFIFSREALYVCCK